MNVIEYQWMSVKLWISVFEKDEFLRNIWFLAHLFKQIKMLNFPQISGNFQKD